MKISSSAVRGTAAVSSRRPIPPRWLSLLLAPLLLAQCSKKSDSRAGGGPPGGPPVPVLVTEVRKKDVPLELPAIGSVQPRASVTVRPQVGGQLAAAHFQEGSFVKAGDPLFTIDPRPYQVALAQAEASLEEARAEEKNAVSQAARYQRLERSGSASKEAIEQIQTAAQTARAKVLAAEAAVRSARLQLEYCEIQAPLGGRAGRLLVDPGNVVQANVTDLVVIHEVRPAEVSFTVAERHLPNVRKFLAKGALEVEAKPEAADAEPQRGTLAFVDNTVRSATGTIELRALFPNEKQELWPGQFVDVRLRLTVEKGVLTIPLKAVQTGQKSQYVYVVKPDKTVEMRPVKPERSAAGEAVIAEGLDEGELVVLDGHVRLSPGARVEIKGDLDGNPPASDPLTGTGRSSSATTAQAAPAEPETRAVPPSTVVR